MKIIFLNIYNGLVDRGSETFVANLASQLSKNHEISVIQGGPPKERLPYRQIQVKIPFILNPDIGANRSRKILVRFVVDIYQLLVLLFTLKSLPYILFKDYDVIFPTNGFWQLLICRLISLVRRKKLVVIGHAGIGRDDLFNILFRPSLFIALTQEAKNWVLSKSPRQKVVVISGGVDTIKFNPEVKAEPIDLPKPILICVAALVPYKRVDLVIKAVSKLKNVSLLVLGVGYLKKDLEKLGKKLLGKRFRLTNVSHTKMAGFYNAGSVLTLASKAKEAFGLTILEAMACNLPVVVNDDPARKEIIGEGGLVVNVEDIDSYAGSLKQSLQTNWGNKPRIQAEKFSWDNIAGQYEQTLKKL
ncbi:MAG TPA: glycosyltransferase family 4 protein [Patescibacteria group bacterium]